MMGKNDKEVQANRAKLIGLLNQILQIEYSFMIHYPRLARALRSEEARSILEELGRDSTRHGNVVSGIIEELGGKAEWSFEPAPDGTDMAAVLRKQLEKEELASQLHQQCVELSSSLSHREKLNALVKDEKWHMKAVETAISKLLMK